MSECSSTTPSRAGTPVAALPETITARAYRFAWDQASRRGPESVSGTTEGRGDYITAKPRLDLFGASSSTLPLGSIPAEWSSSKHGFNAISTVLNNPHKRQAPPKAHSALPAVPPADLPRVRRKDFDGYLRVVGPEWTQFEKNMQLGQEGAAHLSDSLGEGSSSMLRTPPRSLPPLDTVPSVFFKPDFSLGDAQVFREVTEQGEDGGEGLDPSSLSYSLPLLEKLSHYADTVEQHLVQEISKRSSSFFAALTNLNELQTESEECLDRISKLRGLLKDVDEKGSKKGLQIVRKEARLRNMGRVKDNVKFISGVMEMSSVAKGLVTAGQWSEALDIIEEIESLWDDSALSTSDPPPLSATTSRPSMLEPVSEAPGSLQEPSHKSIRSRPHPPLSTLHAFASLPEHLRVLSLNITTSLSSEVVEALRSDLLDRVNTPSEHPSESPTWTTRNESLGDRLRPLLNNLMRTKGVKSAMLAWRDVALSEVKSIAIRHLSGFTIDDLIPNSDSDNKSDSRPGLGNHLRNLEQPEFLSLILSVYHSYITCVEGLQAQGRIIMEGLSCVSSITSSTLQSLEEELADILSSATELSNSVAASLISPRSERHASLELPEFMQFFDESWSFVVKCEVICRRMIVGLRGVVVSQAKVFLQSFHQQRLSRSAKLVEDEQWNPAEISPAVQHMTNIIIDSAVHDSAELVFKSNGSSAVPDPSANGAHPPPPEPSSPIPRPTKANGTASKHLHIEERTYYAVSATTASLALLLDYIRLVVNLSILTTDAMSRVIEFMKAFNSRTCQVVLGAGAMRSAGLKNITAKHLALASQSLSIMIVLIPYVRETFRRHLSSKQAIMLVEFDKLKRDYQEHQNEIHDKLIAIMGDRLSVHIKTLQAVDWNVPKPGDGVNDYIEILVKETVTLHKVLTRYLPTPTVEYVMSQVLAAINHRLSEEYGGIELPHQEAKNRLLADARYLQQKLSALKNISTMSSMLETVVSEKGVPRPALPSPTPSAISSSGGQSASRLKGFLSGKSVPPTPALDKDLPTPVPTPTPPIVSATPTSVPLPTSPSPPVMKRASTLNGRLEQLMGGLVNHNHNLLTEKALPSPREELLPSNGFKQVESPRLGEALDRDQDENDGVSRSMSTTPSGEPRQSEATGEVTSSPESLVPQIEGITTVGVDGVISNSPTQEDHDGLLSSPSPSPAAGNS
ncbi:hypothetical protein PTI98_003086 [Pleurotus ostreatus]|nr:hypothetical protein PTI98_003086 [Pleurotus ostreatus]